MKQRILTLVIALLAIAGLRAQAPFADEHLTFRVTYKWGIIQKVAGSAEITLRRKPDHYEAIMTARTLPWADNIFMVRDTLRGQMRISDMQPLLYDKSTHESDKYRHDIIRYSYTGNRAVGNVHRIQRDKKGATITADTLLTALNPATDMLSVYYLVRQLPFDTMKPGSVAKANIFSGKKIERLAVTYDGDETVELNGRRYPCRRIHFMFSSERIKNTSKPMKAWVCKEAPYIPVKLEGELPIGKIQILYNEP